MDILGAAVSRPNPHGRAAPLARIETADRLIDRIVYQLCEPTDEEIAIVEGSES
jgi:hypothetical protein